MHTNIKNKIEENCSKRTIKWQNKKRKMLGNLIEASKITNYCTKTTAIITVKKKIFVIRVALWRANR